VSVGGLGQEGAGQPNAGCEDVCVVLVGVLNCATRVLMEVEN
jgi:hypothetical protein